MTESSKQRSSERSRWGLLAAVVMLGGGAVFWLVDVPVNRPGRTPSSTIAATFREAADAPVGRNAPLSAAARRVLATLESEGEVALLTIASADVAPLLGHLMRSTSSVEERRWGLALLRDWAESNPRAAAEWFTAQSGLTGRSAAVEQIASAWAEHEFSKALDWALKLPAGSERQSSLTTVLYEGARDYPELAVAVALQELPADGGRDDLVRYATAQWAAVEPAAVWPWARQLAAGDFRDRIVATVATEWSESDPVAGATLAAESLPAGRLQDDTVMAVVERWVQTDPRATVEWVMTGLPDGPLRQVAVTEMVKIWAEQDIGEVRQWLAELAPGPILDAATAVYKSKLSQVNHPPAELGSPDS